MGHFRRGPSVEPSQFKFHCGDSEIFVVDKYKYLGLVFSEFLDYGQMAKLVAQSPHTALGLLVAKCESHGDMPLELCLHRSSPVPSQLVLSRCWIKDPSDKFVWRNWLETTPTPYMDMCSMPVVSFSQNGCVMVKPKGICLVSWKEKLDG